MKMKRLIIGSIVGLVLLVAPVMAATRWQVTMSTPAALINTKTFNVDYTALSVEPGDSMTVELFENGNSLGSQSTSTQFGNSGSFPVTVPADGTYEFKLAATNNNDGEDPSKSAGPVNVTVDTTAPSAPTYNGKQRNGNHYTLSFTAPSDGDVAEVRIYASASRSFTANATTQVGLLTIGSGETKTFDYTAPDSNERFFALQTFDRAGNFSTLAADANTNIAQGTPASAGVTSNGSVAGGTATTGGQTATSGDNDGQNAGGGPQGKNGNVLGQESSKSRGNWLYVLLAIAAIVLGYYALIYRPNHRGPSSDKKS